MTNSPVVDGLWEGHTHALSDFGCADKLVCVDLASHRVNLPESIETEGEYIHPHTCYSEYV